MNFGGTNKVGKYPSPKITFVDICIKTKKNESVIKYISQYRFAVVLSNLCSLNLRAQTAWAFAFIQLCISLSVLIDDCAQIPITRVFVCSFYWCAAFVLKSIRILTSTLSVFSILYYTTNSREENSSNLRSCALTHTVAVIVKRWSLTFMIFWKLYAKALCCRTYLTPTNRN